MGYSVHFRLSLYVLGNILVLIKIHYNTIQYKYFNGIKHTKCFSLKAYTYIKQRYQANNLPEAIGGIAFSTSDVNY